MAVDTFGGWHSVALQTTTKLGLQMARVVGKEEAEAVRHLRQRATVWDRCGFDGRKLEGDEVFPDADIDDDSDVNDSEAAV